MIEIKAKCCGTCSNCILLQIQAESPPAPVLGEFKIGAYIQDCYATQSICYNFKNKRWEYYERDEHDDDFRPKFYNTQLFNLIQKLKGAEKFSDTYPALPTGLIVTILLFILVRRSGRVD